MSTSRNRLKELIAQHCLLSGREFTLSTGQKSNFYFDCKAATLNGEALALIAEEFLEEIEQMPEKPTAIGGLTMGADFMTAAVVVLSHLKGRSIRSGSIVRKEAKKHGTQNKIENELPPGTAIVVVDDVVTSGNSTVQACDEFEAAGYRIVGILAIVDREAGGMEKLERRYGHVRALFRKSDFPDLTVAASGVANRAAA